MKGRRFSWTLFLMGTLVLLIHGVAMATCTDATDTSRFVGWTKPGLGTADGVRSNIIKQSAAINCGDHGGHSVWVMLDNNATPQKYMQIGYKHRKIGGNEISERIFSQYKDDDGNVHDKSVDDSGNPVTPPAQTTYRVEWNGSTYVMKYGDTTWITVPAGDVDGWAGNGVARADWCGETHDLNDPMPGTSNDPVRFAGCSYRLRGDADYTTLTTDNHATPVNSAPDHYDLCDYDMPFGACHTGEGLTPNLAIWDKNP